MAAYEASTTGLRAALGDPSLHQLGNSVTHPPLPETLKLLSDMSNRKHLFPHDYIAVPPYWKALIPSEENLHQLAKETVVFVKHDTSSACTVKSISFSAGYPNMYNDYAIRTFVYGDPRDSAAHAIAQIWHGIRMLPDKKVFIQVNAPTDCDRKELHELLGWMGCRHMTTGYYEASEAILYEESFPWPAKL